MTSTAVGDNLACLILEPMLGAGGTIAATTEYLRLARELCTKHGALLILDEMITGFRFHAGGLGALHGVTPDLAIYGKALGGGMPVAAVAGRAEVMAEVARATGPRVAFSGGTYSAHPASMLAAKVFLEHLESLERDLPPARRARCGHADAVETAFAEAGILARCTGAVDELDCGSSLVTLHFPHDEAIELDTPEAVFDPASCDVALRQKVLGLALLVEDVHLVLAHGAASTTHTDEDVAFLGEACRKQPTGSPVPVRSSARLGQVQIAGAKDAQHYRIIERLKRSAFRSLKGVFAIFAAFAVKPCVLGTSAAAQSRPNSGSVLVRGFLAEVRSAEHWR